jgi:glycerol-3-phosphate O-acyltransferase / dihydroxyacetone phosphate acyltransferase
MVEEPSDVAYEKPAPVLSFYYLTRALMKFCMHAFFRDITVLGTHNIPKKGPVIFCGNHQNQFCDGCILFSHSERDVRFMVAAKSMRRPVLK